MSIPFLTSSRSWLAAAGFVATAGLAGTAVAGPAWATPGTAAAVTAAAPKSPPTGRHPAGPASSANRLATLKAQADKRINALLARIGKATTRAQSDPNLAGLTGKLADLSQQLKTLRTQVASAPDVATLRSDLQSALKGIRSDPVLQQVAVVERVDQLSTRLGKLSGLVPRIQSRLDAARASGTDTSQADSALADLQTKLADAQGKISGLAQSVLSGATSVADARTTLKSLQADAKAIRADLWTVRQALGGSGAKPRAGRRAPAAATSSQL